MVDHLPVINDGYNDTKLTHCLVLGLTAASRQPLSLQGAASFWFQEKLLTQI